MNLHSIETTFHGKQFVAIPVKEFKKVKAILEEYEMLRDIKAYDEAMNRLNHGEESLSSEFVHELFDCSTTGERTRAWRRYRKMNQEQLAKMANISRSYLSDIERDERQGTISTMKAIAQALKCDLDDLA